MDVLGEWAWGALQALCEWVVRMVTGRSSLERLCSRECHDERMTAAFARELDRARGGVLGNVARQIFHMPARAFSVPEMATELVTRQKIAADNHVARANVAHCLEGLLFVNVVLMRIQTMRETAYDPKSEQHEEMLEALWTNLKPGIERQGGRYTTHWSEIGFQGKDPATDFRAMGLFGLVQLGFFAQEMQEDATEALAVVSHSTKYLPFSATGINVSSFVCDLLEERRLDERLYRVLEGAFLQHDRSSPANNEELVELGVREVHRVFAEIFGDIITAWRDDPRVSNIMSFPPIFAEIRKKWRANLHPVCYMDTTDGPTTSTGFQHHHQYHERQQRTQPHQDYPQPQRPNSDHESRAPDAATSLGSARVHPEPDPAVTEAQQQQQQQQQQQEQSQR